jgi:hypothetical protein
MVLAGDRSARGQRWRAIPHGVLQHHGVGIVSGVNVDAVHQLDELPVFGRAMAASLVQLFARTSLYRRVRPAGGRR